MKTLHNSLQTYLFGFLLLSVAALQSCSQFDKIGLDNATNLSTSLTELMGKATGKYSSQSDAIQKVTTALDSAVKYAQGKKKNKEIGESWKTLQTEIVAPFFARWKEKGSLDKDFIKEATAQVTKSLEAIRKAELARK